LDISGKKCGSDLSMFKCLDFTHPNSNKKHQHSNSKSGSRSAMKKHRKKCNAQEEACMMHRKCSQSIGRSTMHKKQTQWRRCEAKEVMTVKSDETT
jgi:hypothetical protein